MLRKVRRIMLQIQDIMCTLEKRQKELERVICNGKKVEKELPQGRLRINHNRGVVEYYRITEKNDTCGKYLRKSDKELIRKLAQREYIDKQIKCAKEEKEEIKRIIKALGKVVVMESSKKDILYQSDMVYSGMSADKKELVVPMLMSNYEYAAKWEKEEYKNNNFKSEEKVYSTKKGDMVRSKSEVMLANMYYELGIPYRYEAELRLKNGRITYPDFTVLDVASRQEIYHEHMGLIDDKEYRMHNLQKIEEYRKSGIFAGKNLFITYESSGCPLNIREIEKCVRWMFCK